MKVKLCNYAGCNAIIKFNERYCTKHIGEVKKRVPFENAIRYNEALYKTAQWRRLKKQVLNEQPYCNKCGASRKEAVLEVHHIVAPRGNEALFFDMNNLETVCRSCHRTITAGEIRASR